MAILIQYRVLGSNYDATASFDVTASSEEEALAVASKVIPSYYAYEPYAKPFASLDRLFREHRPWEEGYLSLIWGINGYGRFETVLTAEQVETLHTKGEALRAELKDGDVSPHGLAIKYGLPVNYLFMLR